MVLTTGPVRVTWPVPRPACHSDTLPTRQGSGTQLSWQRASVPGPRGPVSRAPALGQVGRGCPHSAVCLLTGQVTGSRSESSSGEPT